MINSKNLSIYFLLIFSSLSIYSAKKTPLIEIKQLKVLSDSDQHNFDYYFFEGVRLKEEKKYDEAIESYRMCEAIDSTDAGLNAELGVLYAISGLKDEAIAHLEKAVKTEPDNWWFNLRLISAYTDNNQLENAISVAESLTKYFPCKEDVYQILISLYKQNNQFKKAIASLDKIESISGIDESTSFEKFRLYVQINQLKKGIAEIEKLIKKFPSETRYKVLRGDIYMQQKKPAKALEIYNNVIETDPQNPQVYISLSEYYENNKEPEKAMESILKALKSDDFGVYEKVQILGQYAQNLISDSTRFNETESLFKLLVDKYPLEEQVHNYYSVFLQFRKRYPEAISELETMVNINPKNEQTWLQLIQLNFAQKNPTQAAEVSQRAIEQIPDYAQLYYLKAIAEYQLEKYDDAVKTGREGINIIKSTEASLKSDIYALIGDSWYKLEQKDSAYVEYDNAVNSNSQNIQVLNNYAYYLSLDKTDLKKAERMSAVTVEKEPKNSTYLDTYAWIFFQQGNFVLAKFYIERAMDNLSPEYDPGIILEHYGDILFMNKDDKKAVEMWKKSYEAGNSTEELKNKIDNNGWKRD